MTEADVNLPLEVEQSENRPTPAPWYAVADDEIGGWSVCNTPAAVSRHNSAKGHRVVGNFTRRADAELVAALRNLMDVDLQRQGHGG